MSEKIIQNQGLPPSLKPMQPMSQVFPLILLPNGFPYPGCPDCQMPVKELHIKRMRSPSALQPGNTPQGIQLWVTVCQGDKCLTQHSLGLWRVYTVDARNPQRALCRLTETIEPRLGESVNSGVCLTYEQARQRGNPVAESTHDVLVSTPTRK